MKTLKEAIEIVIDALDDKADSAEGRDLDFLLLAINELQNLEEN